MIPRSAAPSTLKKMVSGRFLCAIILQSREHVHLDDFLGYQEVFMATQLEQWPDVDEWVMIKGGWSLQALKQVSHGGRQTLYIPPKLPCVSFVPVRFFDICKTNCPLVCKSRCKPPAVMPTTLHCSVGRKPGSSDYMHVRDMADIGIPFKQLIHISAHVPMTRYHKGILHWG